MTSVPWRLFMDDDQGTPWFLKLIESVGFCCMLVAVEEGVRRIFGLGPAMPLYACIAALALGTILYYLGNAKGRKHSAASRVAKKIKDLAATARRDKPQINHTFSVAELCSSLDEKEPMVLMALEQLEKSGNARYILDRWEIDWPSRKPTGGSTY